MNNVFGRVGGKRGKYEAQQQLFMPFGFGGTGHKRVFKERELSIR
jgi:hypothetical protein